MLFSMFCWGMSWSSGKVLGSYGSSGSIALLRFGLTFFSLAPALYFLKQDWKIQPKGIPVLFGASLSMCVYTFLFFEGLHHGKPGAGGVLVTILNPILAYLVQLYINQKRPSTKEIIGLLIGLLAGIILLKIWADPYAVIAPGNIYFVLASCVWVIISILTSKSTLYGTSMAFSTWMFAICTLLMLFYAGFSESVTILEKSDGKFWLNLFFIATITTSLATSFFFFATAKLGVSKASSFIFLVPLSAALGAWLFINEVPQLHTIIGGLLGLIAVYILNKK